MDENFTALELGKNFFDAIKEEPERVRTGLSGLDALLGGGLPQSLTILGAMSGFGKSTLALQIARNISAAERPVLYFSLEMPSSAIAEKAFKRALFEENEKISPKNAEKALSELRAALNSKDGAASETRSDAMTTAEKCANDHRNLFIVERDNSGKSISVDDIENTLRELMNKTKIKPVVIVDYLQILADPSEIFTDERRALDDNINKLWAAANNNKIPFLVISSLNRVSYDEPVTLASFKGSGNIEYTADVALALQDNIFLENFGRNYNKRPSPPKPESGEPELRKVDIVVLKNRYGKSGFPNAVCSMSFYPEFSCFAEKEKRLSEDEKRENKYLKLLDKFELDFFKGRV